MTNAKPKPANQIGILGQLRSLRPNRPLRIDEELAVAELQGTQLRYELTPTSQDRAFTLDDFDRHPKLAITADPDLPIETLSYWNGNRWTIITQTNCGRRQRRRLVLGEYYQIVNTPRHEHNDSPTTTQARERFVSAVLMPHNTVNRHWVQHMSTVCQLARRFDVTPQEMRDRLTAVGVIEPARSAA